MLIASTTVLASNPKMNVTVSDGSGKSVFKGVTQRYGVFESSFLPRGDYVVVLQAQKAAEVTGRRFRLEASGGAEKVSADDVPGEKFVQPGVAMRIKVGESAADSVKKDPRFNNAAAKRALDRMETESRWRVRGQVTER
jgi:hypothetical protein